MNEETGNARIRICFAKRAYDIKDYSQVFPGHGGVLDRFDSVFFSSAMFLGFIIFEINFIDVLLAGAGF